MGSVVAVQQIPSFEGNTLWNDEQINEEGITRLKVELNTNPRCYIHIGCPVHRNFEKIIELYTRLSEEAPKAGLERGFVEIDVTAFCQAPPPKDLLVVLPLRNIAAKILPCFTSIFGGLSKDAVSRENLAKEIVTIFRERTGTKVSASVNGNHVFLHCPYKKLPADFTKLPLDIWKIIDSYLSLRDRVNLHSSWKGARTAGMLASAFADSDGVSTILWNGGRKYPQNYHDDDPNSWAFLEQVKTLGAIKNDVKALNLSDRYFTGKNLRDILQFFPNLVTLDIARAYSWNAEHLDVLASFTQLTELHLPAVALKSDNERSLEEMCKKLKKLESLSFTRDTALPLQQHLFAENEQIFSYLPSTLKKLSLNSCLITDEHIRPLHKLENLEELQIVNPRDDYRGTNHDYLPVNLTCLHLRRSIFRDDAITPLKRLTKLKELNLSGCSLITGTSFHSLPPSLISLHCDGCQLSQIAIDQMNHLSQLREFSFNMPFVMPEITHLNLPKSIQILSLRDWRAPFCLLNLSELQSLPQLVSLDIRDNILLAADDYHLPPTLKRLRFGNGSWSISNDFNLPFLSPLTQLEELQVKVCHLITLYLLSKRQLPKSLRLLEIVPVGGCDNIITKEQSQKYPALMKQMESLQSKCKDCDVRILWKGAQSFFPFHCS